MKISPLVAELFHADRRTEGQRDRRDEANNSFLQFYERASKRKRQRVKDYEVLKILHFVLR